MDHDEQEEDEMRQQTQDILAARGVPFEWPSSDEYEQPSAVENLVAGVFLIGWLIFSAWLIYRLAHA